MNFGRAVRSYQNLLQHQDYGPQSGAIVLPCDIYDQHRPVHGHTNRSLNVKSLKRISSIVRTSQQVRGEIHQLRSVRPAT